MSNQDKLTIVVRLMGLYFLWIATNALFLVFFTSFMVPKSSSTSVLLDVFSGGQTNNIYLLRGIATLIVQVIFYVFILTKSRKIATWLTHDISNKSNAISTDISDIVPISVKIFGLALFVFTIKDFTKSLPSLMFTIEHPLTSYVFILFILQILFSLVLILRTSVITKLIQRLSK